MSSRGYDGPMTHQEYIQKKYLSQSDYESKPKKRKKIKSDVKVKAPTVKIVDEDVDYRTLGKRHDSDEEEIYFGTKEEKPQIAAVIDERPLAVRAGDYDRSKWRKIGGDDDEDENISAVSCDFDKSNKSKPSTSGTATNSSDSTKQKRSKSRESSKTLSGKKAGLSSAKDIRVELDELKRKNDRAMQGMTDEASGRNAKTVFRDRRTGRIRDLEHELAEKEEEMREKALRDAERKAKFDRQSRGLVQHDAKLAKLESDLHEMSKPLARYGDDQDLDQLLRERDRADDPMLAEIRQKREAEKRAKNPDLPVVPKYRGPPAPPNRFAIEPGYRWDGVDRSNGYEAKLFLRSATQESAQEEAYRWSTQDM